MKNSKKTTVTTDNQIKQNITAPNSKTSVFQYDTKLQLVNTYKSVLEAARSAGVSGVSVHKSIQGTRNLAGGYFWYKGYEPLTDFPDKWIEYITMGAPKGSEAKAVIQMDKDGQFVAEYASIRKAAKALNVLERGISLALNGTYKTAYGYKWKLKEQ